MAKQIINIFLNITVSPDASPKESVKDEVNHDFYEMIQEVEIARKKWGGDAQSIMEHCSYAMPKDHSWKELREYAERVYLGADCQSAGKVWVEKHSGLPQGLIDCAWDWCMSGQLMLDAVIKGLAERVDLESGNQAYFVAVSKPIVG